MKIRRTLAAIVLASLMTTMSSVHAQSIGAGIGILDLAGANNTFDTPSDGTTDQSRQNLDDTFFANLGAGDYSASTWSFRAGQTGSVIPYLAVSTGDNAYEIVAVGDRVDVGADDIDVDMTVPFGGSGFSLSEATDVFAGIVNPMEEGSQNPVYTNLNSGSTVDHDNNADGAMSPAIVGGAVDGFGHGNLSRSYAFSVNVVPEPSSMMLTTLAGLGLLAMRRRR